MLRKFSTSRTKEDNLKLGVLTAISAGMVNVLSLIIFFSFTSNVTGHYAILASEIVKGNYYQIAMVFSWIFLFFFGGFLSNLIVINFSKSNQYVAHSLPIIIETICLVCVGFYGLYFYQETLLETEILLCFLCLAMGLQNGLTASISNFSVKTTHLTGTTTDLGILFSMFTKREYRNNVDLVIRAKLLFAIMVSYLIGAILSGYLYRFIGFNVFFVVSFLLGIIISYDLYEISRLKLKRSQYIKLNKKNKDQDFESRAS